MNLQSRAWNAFVKAHTTAYRLTGGRIGSRVRGVDVLLLDHIGRKSGQERTSPLLYIQDGEDYVIVASRGGARKHPSWWINLRAHPRATIQVNNRRFEVEAKQAGRLDKRKLWPRLVEVWPDYAEYQKRTEREIPVIRLKPA